MQKIKFVKSLGIFSSVCPLNLYLKRGASRPLAEAIVENKKDIQGRRFWRKWPAAPVAEATREIIEEILKRRLLERRPRTQKLNLLQNRFLSF